LGLGLGICEGLGFWGCEGFMGGFIGRLIGRFIERFYFL